MSSAASAYEFESAAVRRRCAVFDFDDTLAVGCGHEASDPVALFGGAERLALLAALCTDLCASGIQLAVCSYNKYVRPVLPT